MKRDAQALETALRELERLNLRRSRRTVQELPELGSSVIAVVDGRRLVNFCGNDYLGLARHPKLVAAMREASELGAGSGASHLVTGHGIEHARLEAELAEFTGRERALLFSTGYMANLAVVATLAERGESVLLDRLSHASLIDAGLLSGARFRRYRHADAGAATRVLEADARVSLLATDGVFSMDGDMAPLPDLARSCAAHGAWLVVDDAHGLGVVGATGRGTLERFGLGPAEVPVLVGTLGKAFGTFGAFVAGSADLIDILLQRGRSYIYTTALPQAVAAATRVSVVLTQRETWRRERVLELTARFRAAALSSDVPLAASNTPIQPVVLGSAQAALAASRALENAGFWVTAIRPPTVPQGSARLRITLSAAHTESQVDALVDSLGSICRQLRGHEDELTAQDAAALRARQT
jgi:8-amino-7-oxononanoate synthase